MTNETKKDETDNFDYPVDSHVAAKILGCAETTLRSSRTRGILFGKPTPEFEKLGNLKVIYRPSVLEKFMAQFKAQSSTADTHA